MKSKIDSLPDQIENHTLMMKKTSYTAIEEKKKVRWNESDYGIECSYFKDPGHIAGPCEKNVNRDRSCEHCGKKENVIEDV